MKLASILAGIGLLASASAGAVNLNPLGTGQVLLYPYYTVNQNQDTYFSVGNLGGIPQVLKVRFLEGRNGRPALDVDVVLKPHDVWTAAVSVDAGGGAKLVTHDDSCTRPAIPATGIVFTSSGYDGSSTIPADNGPHDIARTREGSIEVIGGAAIFGTPGPDFGPLPIDCSTIFDVLPTAAVVLEAPGGLFGSAAVIDVGAGHYYSFNATAIDNFTWLPLYSADWGPLKPTLNDANSAEDDAGHPVAYFFVSNANPTLGVPQRGEYEKGVDAVSAVLIADTIENDYIVDAGLGANTDWVLTMPTKHLYVDPIYPDANDDSSDHWLGCCSAFLYDRSGALQGGAPVGFQLAYSTNVVSFLRNGGPASGVFGSTLNVNVTPAADDGTMRLELPSDHSTPGAGDSDTGLGYDNGALYGAPVIGFMAYNIVNANAQPGLLANYGAVSEHRRTTCATSAFLNSFICQY